MLGSAILKCDPLGELDISLSVDLGDVGPRMAKHDLRALDAKVAANLGSARMSQLMWMPMTHRDPSVP